MHGQSLKDGILSGWHDSKPLLVVFTLAEYNGRNNKPLYERICTYAEQHQLTVIEVVLQGLDKVLSDLE